MSFEWIGVFYKALWGFDGLRELRDINFHLVPSQDYEHQMTPMKPEL